MEEKDIERSCRACMVTGTDKRYHSLLQEPLKSAFTDSTSIQVFNSDPISTHICSICVARCEAAKFFRDMAIDNDRKQKNLLKDAEGEEGREATISECDAVEYHLDPLEEEEEQQENEKYQQQVEAIPPLYEIEEDSDVEEGEEDGYETVSDEVVFEEEEEAFVAEDIIQTPTEGDHPKPAQKSSSHPRKIASPPADVEVCQFCSAPFRFRSSLMTHYLDQHPEETFNCDACSKSFGSAQTWRVHNCERNKGQFTCEVCGKQFLHRSMLSVHQKTHSEERYPCEICQKVFKRLSQFKTHLKRHATGKNFLCDVCLKGFKERRELVRHTQLVHSDQRPFKCDRCPSAFAFRYMLTRHSQVHTGVRPFPCSVCGQSLSSMNALKHHMYTHTGAKPYTCDFCPAAFRVKVNLSRHLKEHEGEQQPQEANMEEEAGDEEEEDHVSDSIIVCMDTNTY